MNAVTRPEWMTVPDGFEWDLEPRIGAAPNPRARALEWVNAHGRRIVVALVTERAIPGTWHAEIGRYRLGWDHRRYVIAPSLDAACGWAARWARQHADAIRREADEAYEATRLPLHRGATSA